MYLLLQNRKKTTRPFMMTLEECAACYIIIYNVYKRYPLYYKIVEILIKTKCSLRFGDSILKQEVHIHCYQIPW